jgi:hypothetical protein
MRQQHTHAACVDSVDAMTGGAGRNANADLAQPGLHRIGRGVWSVGFLIKRGDGNGRAGGEPSDVHTLFLLLTHTRFLSLSHTHTQLPRSHTHSHTLSHTGGEPADVHTRTLSLSLTHTHARSLSLSLSHTRNSRSHTHTHPLSLTHTLTHSLSHRRRTFGRTRRSSSTTSCHQLPETAYFGTGSTFLSG